MRLTYLIGRLDRLVSRRMTEVLARQGLTLPQYTALSVLRARGQSTNAQLAERSFITPQSANEVVKAMEANGWVSRDTDALNRRLVLLSLTQQGSELLDECDKAVDEIESAMLHDLAPISEDALRQALYGCVRNLRAA
ncbi:MAG TPA: MarR family transcriptional regulator [Paraburkholderia sp.]|nr:MarR family transcriptional regulator [Paraburkholderia sp.]